MTIIVILLSHKNKLT